MEEKIRTFETGATRDTDKDKLAYEGFFSPIVLKAFAEYMNKHRSMPDGSIREPDNWQKTYGERHYQTCMDCLLRHVMDLWLEHDGFPSRDGIKDAIFGIMFNSMAYLYKILKDEMAGNAVSCHAEGTEINENEASNTNV